PASPACAAAGRRAPPDGSAVPLREAIARVVDGHDLSESEMSACVEEIRSGARGAALVAGRLVALRMNGEAVAELAGAARVLRAHAVSIPDVPADAIDTCGTGGDGAGTLNVSTAAGLVAAAAGVPVAKHGNRAVSGAVGGADVLEALAHGRVRLGTERGWVVHGAGGLDELSLEGESVVAEVAGESIRLHTVTAAEAGLASAPHTTLRIASVADAAERLRAVLAGERGPGRDVVCLNAAAALVVAGRAAGVRGGAVLAAAAIDRGRVSALLERLIAFTTRHAERAS